MSKYLLTNNVDTTLNGSITNTATTITLSSAANLPSSIPGGTYFAVTLNDAATELVFEICYATAVSGANLTVIRGQEGTTAQAWSSGDFVYAAATAGYLNDLVDLNSAQSITGAKTFSTALTAPGLMVTGTTASSFNVGTDATNLLIRNYTSGGDIILQSNSGSNLMTLSNAGALFAFSSLVIGASSGGSSGVGDLTIAHSGSATNGLIAFGTAVSKYLDYGLTNGSAFTFTGGQVFIASGGINVTGATTLTGNISATGNMSLSGTYSGTNVSLTGYALSDAGVVVGLGSVVATPPSAGQCAFWTDGGSTVDFVAGTGGATYAFLNSNSSFGAYSPLDASAFNVTSDARFKTEIEDIESAVEMIMRLRPKSYVKDGQLGYGFTTQDVSEVAPRLVHEDRKGRGLLDYMGLIAPLVRMVQEQQEQIDALKRQIGGAQP